MFDKKLADQILAMELEPLLRFLEGNIGVLAQKGATLRMFEKRSLRQAKEIVERSGQNERAI